MVSLETRSGDVLRSASAYNSKTAQTEFVDADQLGSDRRRPGVMQAATPARSS